MKILLDDFRNLRQVFEFNRYSIFVDDDGWLTVKNYNEFITLIQETDFSTIEFITFDHDLSDQHYDYSINSEDYTEKTGLDCAKWLVEYCINNNFKFPEYFVHSMNPAGKENINKYIENYKKHYENKD